MVTPVVWTGSFNFPSCQKILANGSQFWNFLAQARKIKNTRISFANKCKEAITGLEINGGIFQSFNLKWARFSAQTQAGRRIISLDVLLKISQQRNTTQLLNTIVEHSENCSFSKNSQSKNFLIILGFPRATLVNSVTFSHVFQPHQLLMILNVLRFEGE